MSSPEGRWLDSLEKKIGWFALANLGLFLSALQVFGYFAYLMNPEILTRISLNPQAILSGEIWRVITFLAIPLDRSPLFMLLAVWFLYFSVNLLESQWGEFKTTFYLFIALLITNLFALFTGVEIGSFRYIELSILFALATLFPNVELLLLFFPVKLKYIGLFSLALIIYEFISSDVLTRYYILLVYTNYFVFFGGHGFNTLIQAWRRWNYKRNTKN
ncbi:MAG: hypothetical protein OEV78_09780 [Spirochaetia bacterium]|nr:hypothetical protein [Spirochaetia bacterium]